MICLNCGVEYSHIGKYKRFCSSRCQNTYYKNRQSGPFTIKGQLIDDKLLAELLEKNIVVAYLDVSGEPHYGLKPAARRLIYGLRIPMGFNILHFGVSKMTTKTPGRVQQKTANGPVPARVLISIKEGKNQ